MCSSRMAMCNLNTSVIEMLRGTKIIDSYYFNKEHSLLCFN